MNLSDKGVTELGTWLVGGVIAGEVLRLDEPLSFWGGFDASTGCIIDRSHPQHGASLKGKVVAMPGSRGSSGTPGVLGEAIRRGTGPAAIIITKADTNLTAGPLTAKALYSASCPIVVVDQSTFDSLGDHVGPIVDPAIADPKLSGPEFGDPILSDPELNDPKT